MRDLHYEVEKLRGKIRLFQQEHDSLRKDSERLQSEIRDAELKILEMRSLENQVRQRKSELALVSLKLRNVARQKMRLEQRELPELERELKGLKRDSTFRQG